MTTTTLPRAARALARRGVAAVACCAAATQQQQQQLSSTLPLLTAAAAALTATGRPFCTTTTSSITTSSSSNGPAAKHLLSRYEALLASGTLRPDQQQARLVSQLSDLLDELQGYSARLQAHKAARAAYDARFQQRLQELELLDGTQQQQDEQQQQQQEAASSSTTWRQLLANMLPPFAGGSPAPAKQQTPAQRARLAAAARRARVVAELGPGPEPPAAPQGIYVYGTVGSGKSLLAMDLFFEALQRVQLDHARRLHFNTAMLELHSRLHRLDTQRRERQLRRRQQEEARANALAAAAAAAGGDGQPPPLPLPHPHDDDEEHAEQDKVLIGAAAAAAGGEQHDAEHHGDAVDTTGDAEAEAGEQRIVSRWFDDAVWQQKEAKAAVLAIRRHLRASRAGQVPAARLAAANAAVMSAAARSFIRGGPDPASGWGPAAGGSSSSSGDRLAAVLCFDEMQVGDVWSATALKALMEALTAEGCVVVTTSNRHPAELPRHGLHEALFGHFLHTLLTSCRLFELSAGADYRRLGLTAAATQLLQQPLLEQQQQEHVPSPSSSSSSSSSQRSYFFPLGPAADAALQARWAQLTGDASTTVSSSNNGQRQRVPVMFGRTLEVPRASNGVAFFEFDDLCGQPLGTADYVALAATYHTLFLAGIPALSFNNRDKARRFITLLDELYNARVALVCTAALPPDQLFSDTHGGAESPLLDLEQLQFEGAVEGSKLRTDLTADGGVAPVASDPRAAAEAAALLGGAEERFAFARAVSRLYEMQGPLFAAGRHHHAHHQHHHARSS